MSIFDICKSVPPAKPGDLLWLACDVSSLMAQMNNIPEDSPAWHEHVGEIFRHRMALADSVAITNLDLLMLVFAARQAVCVLKHADELAMPDGAREYWANEAWHALSRAQATLEQRCGVTTDELDLDLAGGPVRKSE